MWTLTKSIIKCAGVLAAGILHPAASLPAFAQAQPPIISNTATAQWDAGSQTLSRTSNTVQFAVENVQTPAPVLALFHFSNAPGATTVNLPSTICFGSGGATPVALSGAFAGTSTSPASLVPASAIRAGEPLVIQVDAAAKNLNPTAVDQFEVTIVTANGDRERLTLTESAPNSGRFTGFINTAAVPPRAVQGDCVLSVRAGDTLRVELDDSSTGASVGNAEVEILIDPFGLAFDSGDGRPVDGTRITIIDVATGNPATVFGDDGVSSFPSTIVAGSTVTFTLLLQGFTDSLSCDQERIACW